MTAFPYYHKDELKSSQMAPLLAIVPRRLGTGFVKRKLFEFIIHCEGGIYTSYTLRMLLFEKRNITLGSYSYGTLDVIFALRPRTFIGRYTSIGPGVQMFNANHPYLTISTHPYFYTDKEGRENVLRHDLFVGHDVWLGANAIVCPGCRRIGNGAVIAAGAVVTKDVPDYAIVAGNPAKVIKMRFSQPIVEKLVRSEWWNLPFEKVNSCRHEMTLPLDESLLHSFLDRIASLQRSQDSCPHTQKSI